MAVKKIRDAKNGKPQVWEAKVSKFDPAIGKKRQLRARASTKWGAETLETELKQKLITLISGLQIPVWSELVQKYMDNSVVVGKAASTRANELSILTAHANPVLNGRAVNTITEIDIRNILNRVPAERSISLRHNIRKCLKSVVKFAVENGYLVNNVCQNIKLPKIPKPALNILNKEQIIQFLDAAKRSEIKWYPIWIFGIYTGLRSGELYALRYKHIKIFHGHQVLQIEQAYSKKNGFGPPKNKKTRIVPINTELAKVIEDLKLRNPQQCNPDDFILPRIPSWKQGDAAKDLKAFLQGLGLPPIRFHDLRSCFITQSLFHGVTINAVMALVGHADMKTMMRYVRDSGVEVLGKTEKLNFSGTKSDESEK